MMGSFRVLEEGFCRYRNNGRGSTMEELPQRREGPAGPVPPRVVAEELLIGAGDLPGVSCVHGFHFLPGPSRA
jgi:hypothetical protein